MMKKKVLSGIIASTLSVSLLTSMSPAVYLTQAYADGGSDAYSVNAAEDMSIQTTTAATQPIEGTTTTATTAVSEEQAVLDDLTKKENILFGEFQREKAILSGKLSPVAERLTQDEIDEIISNADSFDDIYKALAAMQKYPDFIGGSGVTKVEYWLDDTGSEKIRLIVEQNDIVYVKCDNKGYITDWQALYRENDVADLVQYKAHIIGSYMIYNDIDASGDINCDGNLSISDVVMFQKWLLGVPDAELLNWKAADFCKDNRLNVFDLALMKRDLIYNK